MGIEKLPVELLQHIIEAALPPVTTSDTVRERYRTLRHCSLVSRQWARVAQLLLFNIVDMEEGASVSKLLANVQPEPRLVHLVGVVRIHSGETGGKGRPLRAFTNLRELYLGFDGTLDLAALTGLPQLENLSVWLTHVRLSSNLQAPAFPSLRLLSTCYGRWDHSARPILAPDHLPGLRGLAFFDGYKHGEGGWMTELRNWQPDLSTFPPSLRIVASTTARFTRDETERTVLYESSCECLTDDLENGICHNGIRPEDLRHLLLDDDGDYSEQIDDNLADVVNMTKKLPKLETLFVALERFTSSTSSRQAFADCVKKRGIRYIELDWSNQHLEGSLVPPQWLEM